MRSDEGLFGESFGIFVSGFPPTFRPVSLSAMSLAVCGKIPLNLRISRNLEITRISAWCICRTLKGGAARRINYVLAYM